MPEAKNKRIRVLLTDGTTTYCVYQVNITPTDLYHGVPGASFSYTYHSSGVHHIKSVEEGYYGRNKEVPLADVQHRSLVSFSFGNTERQCSERGEFIKPSAKKVEAALTIDRRSIPEGARIGINVGIVSPSNVEFVRAIAAIQAVNQVLIYKKVIPMFMCLLLTNGISIKTKLLVSQIFSVHFFIM